MYILHSIHGVCIDHLRYISSLVCYFHIAFALSEFLHYMMLFLHNHIVAFLHFIQAPEVMLFTGVSLQQNSPFIHSHLKLVFYAINSNNVLMRRKNVLLNFIYFTKCRQNNLTYRSVRTHAHKTISDTSISVCSFRYNVKSSTETYILLRKDCKHANFLCTSYPWWLWSKLSNKYIKLHTCVTSECFVMWQILLEISMVHEQKLWFKAFSLMTSAITLWR